MNILLKAGTIILSFSVQAYVLYYAYHYGILSGLVLWDDCEIIRRGIENLDIFSHAHSLMDVLAAGRFVIHAPLSDVQVPIGLMLSGGQIWGPYLLNVAWLILFLLTIFETIDRQNWALAAAVALFILIQPLTINALTYLKSDWTGGLLLAGGLFLLATGFERDSPYLRLLAVTLLGLSILSKLTAFYLPFIAFAILLLFKWHPVFHRKILMSLGTKHRLSSRMTFHSISRRMFALYATIAICPFLLFFLLNFESTVAYIQQARGSIWDDGLSTLERIRYYSFLGPSSWTWGSLHIFFVFFVGAATFLAWTQRSFAYFTTIIILGVIGAMLYVPLIIFRTSVPSFAATFLGVIMAATLISMDFIARSLPHRYSLLAILPITLLIALTTALPFQFQSGAGYKGPVASRIRSDELRQLAKTYDHITDTMLKHSRRETPVVGVFYEHLFAPHPNLAILYFQRTGHLAHVIRVDDLSEPSTSRLLMDADFVLSIIPDAAGSIRGLNEAFPLSRDPARAEDAVLASQRFKLASTFPVDGGEIHLYSSVK